MKRRTFIALFGAACTGSAAAQADPGKDVIGTITVTVFYGTDGEIATAGPRAKAVDGEVAKRLGGERKLKYAKYAELGKDTKPLFRSYENWAQPLPPSDEILLRFEAQSKVSKELMRLDVELWLSRKKILKTDAAMEAGKPLLVLGPQWRGGRLIIAVELAPAPTKSQ
jgi:hypothetical protein